MSDLLSQGRLNCGNELTWLKEIDRSLIADALRRQTLVLLLIIIIEDIQTSLDPSAHYGLLGPIRCLNPSQM